MKAPATVIELVERFDRNLSAYKGGGYNETQLRREFIDPFFKALGWDVDNEGGRAEAYKDVVHEDAVRIGHAVKAPDYGFRIGGVRKFFLEAKKPSVDIKGDVHPAYQLRRYAWSAKLPLSILTDFEEFAVYDCRIKPVKTDRASTARVLYLTYREYPERWDEIAGIFSREAILKGSFDRYVESKRAKRGTAEVDRAFLQEIERWRDLLARNIALRNPGLGRRELNFAVQRTIDRIIFLRICEDRGIERYGRLMGLLNGPRVYPRLFELFRQADDRYDSGLFHFRPERGRSDEGIDAVTPDLVVDDRVLKDILRHLYYPDSPYEFSVLPADILGQVYEQFLGKVIRLTPAHRAVVEEKPEVKKAGGVYYTPTYIVEYIVRQTVGRLLEGRRPGRRGASGGIKVLDPACGSGSFLLGAYQYLLDGYRDEYVRDDPEKWARGRNPRLYQARGGEWRLTTPERKRILLDHIYGVDIDPQAVEVTKLSLLLKVLEGESEETITRQLSLFRERALPDLGDNIKCGNSLIGPDFYEGRQMSLLDEEEMYRLNIFDWEAEFPEIMAAGGFDAVIGNPPYGAMVTENEIEYLRQKYPATKKGLDTYSLFIEKSVHLCKPAGLIAMIVPTGWYSGAKFGTLRRFVACATDPISFVNLPYDIFKAWVDTTIFVVSKRAKLIPWPRTVTCTVTLRSFPKRHHITSVTEFNKEVSSVDLEEWFEDGNDRFLTYADSTTISLIRKIRSSGKALQEFADVQRGVTPFNLTDYPAFPTSRLAFKGTVRRYQIVLGPTYYIRFDETLAEPKPERYFKGNRLLLREMISRRFQLQAVKVTEDFITNKSMQSILPLPDGPDLNYLLGLINSRLMSWYFLQQSQIAQRDDFPKIVLKESRSLPIHPIDFANPADAARHDQLVSLVEEMLDLHEKLAGAREPQTRTVLERRIEAVDQEIDRLVYELYGLTDEEIRIVEEGITG